MATKYDEQKIDALKAAVDLVGGQAELARLVTIEARKKDPDATEVRGNHIWNWINRNIGTPPNHVLNVEAACKGAVSRYELGPDVFGENPEEKTA